MVAVGARADAVAKRYRPWPKGLRTDSLPWFDSPLVQGASRLRYTDKAQMQRPGHTGRKALATKKKKRLQWVQATDTLSVAGAAGAHSWGLMLPTSTRTPGVNYTSAVAVRYPPLNRQVGDHWIVGTHSSGGLEGLVGGYQLVIWKNPSKEFMHARGADLSSVIEPLLQDLMDVHSDESSVLVMCARNEDRDQLLTDSICRGHPQIKVQSVASSAGATATASIVNQPVNGHLNGRPTDPFDQEECYARCTVDRRKRIRFIIFRAQPEHGMLLAIQRISPQQQLVSVLVWQRRTAPLIVTVLNESLQRWNEGSCTRKVCCRNQDEAQSFELSLCLTRLHTAMLIG